jgi:hypothetical protein
MRVDLYSLVHKAQRFHLYRLANDIGHGDCSDAMAMAALGERVLHMLDHLHDHARNEEHYIHPLYRRLGFDLEALKTDHDDLAGTLDGLRALVDEQGWDRLYAGVTALIGVYLPHLEEEERIQQEILWPAYADAELAAVMQRFKLERSPARSRADLELLLPAMSVAEISRMLQGIRSAAPDAVYAGVCQLAACVLDGPRWQQVQSAVRQRAARAISVRACNPAACSPS